MKRLLLILCLIPVLCFSDNNPYITGIPITQGGVTYLLNEDFETNETCPSLGFVQLDGTPDCQATDYKDGNYGNKLSSTGTTEGITYIATDNSLVYLKFDIRISAMDFYNNIVYFREGGSSLGRMITDDQGRFAFVYIATSDQNSGIFTPSVDTWYTIKIRYQSDTGTSNGSVYVWYSAGQNQTLPTSLGAADMSITGKEQVSTPLVNQYEWLNGKNGVNIWYDNIKISTGDPDA